MIVTISFLRIVVNKIWRRFAKTNKACSTSLVDLYRLQLKIRHQVIDYDWKMASSSTSTKQLHHHRQGCMTVFVILTQRYRKIWNVNLLTISCYLHYTKSQHVRQKRACYPKPYPCHRTCSLSQTCVHKEKACYNLLILC